MSNNPLACSTCPVRNLAACSALSEAELDELGRIGKHVKLERGETLFAAGDDELACATLISGALKVSSFGKDGTERILSLIHPAGFVGEMFAPAARHDVIALTDSLLCAFPKKDYAAAIERFPALGRALLRRSAEELFESRSLIDLMSRRTARQKVAGLIFSMAQAAGDSPGTPARSFDLPLNRGEIAGMLGLTIETVSRQLTKLEREGLIDRSGLRGIRMIDAARLRAAAD